MDAKCNLCLSLIVRTVLGGGRYIDFWLCLFSTLCVARVVYGSVVTD